jgi:hypothetical protein
MPAKAGIQASPQRPALTSLDSRFRGNDNQHLVVQSYRTLLYGIPSSLCV